MQQMEQAGDLGNPGRRRVETVVHTLAALGGRSESLAEVAHDARNMVTALGLYCELLDEPGVLAVPFAHYSSELRLVVAASRRLVEKLVALDTQAAQGVTRLETTRPDPARLDTGRLDPARLETPRFDLAALDNAHLEPVRFDSAQSALDAFEPGLSPDPGSSAGPGFSAGPAQSRRWEALFAEPIRNLAAELMANRNLLAALAGPGIAVTVDVESGARPVRLTAEDLTRLLVNLVKNAAEAMPSGGRVQIALRERSAENGDVPQLLLTIEDNGPGIAPDVLGRVFDSGFTTHTHSTGTSGGWPAAHRGLGLAISRSIVEASGGRITAANRTSRAGPNGGADGVSGARFEIELPVPTT